MLEEVDDKDTVVLAKYKNEGPWGMESLINVYGCDADIISDELSIFEFINKLVDFIDMEKYGDAVIERFGEGNLLGISFVQLIRTSCIVGHISEKTGTVYLDIFSCRSYMPEKTADFVTDFFKADRFEVKTFFRD